MENANGRLSISEGSVFTMGGKAAKPAAMKDEAWNLLDRKALGTIRLCLAASVAYNILKEKTTEDVMKPLAKLYEKPSASNKVFLMNRLFNMKMSDNGSSRSFK